MSEEYKKLSELPQAVNPQRCEAYGIEGGKSVRVPLTFATPSEVAQAVSNEERRAITAEDSIAQSLQSEIARSIRAEQILQNSANTSVFCTTKEANDIIKEMYIFPYVATFNVEQITITKEATKYQMTFKDVNGNYSTAYFGNSYSAINGEVVTATITGNGFATGSTMYAVIRWEAISEKVTLNTNLTNLINNSKYSPMITHVMQSYKYVYGSLGNAFIRELYLKDLRREEYEGGTLARTHKYSSTLSAIPQVFSLSSISRNVGGKWIINFGATYNERAYPFLFETTTNPENDDIIKKDILCWIGDGSVQFKATMYAVVDWTQITDGTSISYGRPLLSGVTQKKLSPIICNYIELNKMRQELGLRPINEE